MILLPKFLQFVEIKLINSNNSILFNIFQSCPYAGRRGAGRERGCGGRERGRGGRDLQSPPWMENVRKSTKFNQAKLTLGF